MTTTTPIDIRAAIQAELDRRAAAGKPISGAELSRMSAVTAPKISDYMRGKTGERYANLEKLLGALGLEVRRGR